MCQETPSITSAATSPRAINILSAKARACGAAAPLALYLGSRHVYPRTTSSTGQVKGVSVSAIRLFSASM